LLATSEKLLINSSRYCTRRSKRVSNLQLLRKSITSNGNWLLWSQTLSNH